MSKHEQLILDICQISEALADDPEYDQDWKPRLERLLGFVEAQAERHANCQHGDI